MRYARPNHIVIIGVAAVILCLLFASPTLNLPGLENTLQTQPSEESLAPQEVDEIVIEGEPVFVTSSAGDFYPSSTEAVIWGSQVNGPPLGMGENSATSTDITESYFLYSEYPNLMTQSSFSSPLPAGWEDSGLSYSGGNFQYDQISTSGYLICPAISTVGYEEVEFTIYASLDWIGMATGSVHVWFYDSTGNWDDMGYIPDTGPTGTNHDFASSSAQYQHSGFRVRITYTGFNMLAVFFSGTNWRIDARNDITGYRANIIYEFTGIDYGTFLSERLYVDFDSSSSVEYLDFYFEAGDSTPDALVRSHVNTDFNIDIHALLTGSTCYVMITDELQAGDGDADTWRIDRMYIKLSNAVPINDQPASCSNLNDGDNLYAWFDLYEFHSSVTDADGYTHLDYVELSCYDAPGTGLRWRVRFDEDTNVFSVQAGASYITLGASSFTKSGSNLDVTFRMYINWEHPDSSDDCLYQYVRDSEGGSDGDYYLVNYDYETRLAISGNSIDDGIGTDYRGDISSTATAAGTVTYLGSTIHPLTDMVDVWISAPLHSGAGPWSDATLDSGDFSMTIDTDDAVGIDTYTYRVVPESAGFGGANLLAGSETNTYISDRVEVQYIDSNDHRINVGDTSVILASLRYEYDDAHVTDGVVSVNGHPCAYGSGGVWNFTETLGAVGAVTYNAVSVSDNAHGISEVNMNGQTHQQIWDRVIVLNITCPRPSNHTNIGDILGMYMWITYEYDGTFMTTGTVTMQGIGAAYVSDSIWVFSDSESTPSSNTYDTVAVSGNAYGITLVNQNGMELTVVWDSVTIQMTDPIDQRINLGQNATGIYVSGTYDYSGDPFDGVFVMNSSTFSYASVGIRGYTVGLITGDTYGISTISSNDETFCIWDAIEIFDLSAPEWVLVNQEFNITCQARLMYDGHLLSNMDDISIDAEGAVWDGLHFVITRTYAMSGDLVFSVSSAVENSYGISYLGNSPEALVHVIVPLDICSPTSEFEADGGLYDGVHSGPPLWIHWDPLNDLSPPNFTFTIVGSYISLWNVSSSWSGLEVSSGTAAGSFVLVLESGLPYAQYNHTYAIFAENEAGHHSIQIVYVLVHDYVAPTVNSPSDININEGSTGVSIIWTGDDLHPATYQVRRDDLVIASGLWNSSAESIIVPLDGLPAGEYLFELTLNDTSGISVSDSVVVTVNSVVTTTSTTTTTTTPTTTSTTTTTTTEGGNGAILTIAIMITIAGSVIVVIVIVVLKKK